jgi:DNA-directed RNA polymerase specialized sigma24 family protein
METTPRESSVSLATLIAALPPEERAILTLHYVLGHSVDEIAATLLVEPRTVEVVLKVGKVRLATALGMN